MADRGNAILRFFDRFLGIPLISIMGILRTKHSIPPKPWRKIGVLATAAIGDTILLSAVINDLVRECSESQIFLFVGDSNFSISKLSCKGLKIIPIPVSNPLKAVSIIKPYGDFDLWFDFGPWPRINAVISALVPTFFTLGFKTSGQYRHFAYDCVVAHSSENHEIDNLRNLLNTVAVHSASLPKLGGYSHPKIQGDYIVFHMFPGGYKSSYKEWSAVNWVFLINNLTEQGIQVVITGAAKDKEKADTFFLNCKNHGKIINEAGKINLEETASYLEYARVVVSVNTGIMHLAAAVNAPLIALHGPTNVGRWGPLSTHVINFTATTPSAGCLDLGFEYDRKDRNSLDTIDPQDVLSAVLDMWHDQ